MSAPPTSVDAGTGVAMGSGLLAGWRPGDFLMQRDGRGVLARGVAGRIEVPAMPDQAARAALMAEEALAPVASDARIVAGALPFRGDIPAVLTIPERVVTDPQRLLADLRGPGPPPQLMGRALDASPPLRWHPPPSAAAFGEAVEEAIRRIVAGEVGMVVLRRSLVAA